MYGPLKNYASAGTASERSALASKMIIAVFTKVRIKIQLHILVYFSEWVSKPIQVIMKTESRVSTSFSSTIKIEMPMLTRKLLSPLLEYS